MSMRKILLIIFVVLASLSIVAWLWKTEKNKPGKVPIVWVSDPNPQRFTQIDIFNELNPDINLKLDPGNSDSMKVIVQSSAGMGPDLIGHVTFDRTLGLYLDAGVLMDLTEIAPKYGFSYKTLPKQVQELCFVRVYDPETNTIKRAQFGYPANNANSFLIYNKTIFACINPPCSPPMTDIIKIKKVVGATLGTVICQNLLKLPAPSISAAS